MDGFLPRIFGNLAGVEQLVDDIGSECGELDFHHGTCVVLHGLPNAEAGLLLRRGHFGGGLLCRGGRRLASNIVRATARLPAFATPELRPANVIRLSNICQSGRSDCWAIKYNRATRIWRANDPPALPRAAVAIGEGVPQKIISKGRWVAACTTRQIRSGPQRLISCPRARF